MQQCIQYETSYAELYKQIKAHPSPAISNIPFARIDTTTEALKSIVLDADLTQMPSVVIYYKGKARPFRGVQAAGPVLAYITKLLGPLTITLKDTPSTIAFINAQSYPYDGTTGGSDGAIAAARAGAVSTIRGVHVVGFFSSRESLEEDEFSDFTEAARVLQYREDISFGAVFDRDTIDW